MVVLVFGGHGCKRGMGVCEKAMKLSGFESMMMPQGCVTRAADCLLRMSHAPPPRST